MMMKKAFGVYWNKPTKQACSRAWTGWQIELKTNEPQKQND